MAAEPEGVLRSPEDVIRTLTRFRDVLAPHSGSILFVGASRGSDRDPFHPAFLTAIEARSELVRRLRRLDPRARLLLFLWYVEGRSPTDIARHLGISRVHCYRLRNRALVELASPAEPPTSLPVPAHDLT